MKPKKTALDRYVAPHQVKSSVVTVADLKKVKKEALVMYALCYLAHGEKKNGALAIAHAQIENKKPLRFFVTRDNEVVVNPVITNHTKTPVDSDEGCMSYPESQNKIVPRWHKIEVEFNILQEDGELSERVSQQLSGKDAKVFQHELDHMEGIYIYDL